ncbi:hypothetical protein [Kitasatospora sp. NPDC001683]
MAEVEVPFESGVPACGEHPDVPAAPVFLAVDVDQEFIAQVGIQGGEPGALGGYQLGQGPGCGLRPCGRVAAEQEEQIELEETRGPLVVLGEALRSESPEHLLVGVSELMIRQTFCREVAEGGGKAVQDVVAQR